VIVRLNVFYDRELQDTITSLQADHNNFPQPSDATAYIGTLLGAIERLRGERNDLRRDLSFLESENKFAVQALGSKVVSTVPVVHRAEDRERERRIRRLDLAATASAIMVRHLQQQLEDASAGFARHLDETLQACELKDNMSRDLQARLVAVVQKLEVAQARSSDTSRSALDEAPSADRECKEALDQAEAQLSDLRKLLEDVESQRDSLHLQVNNLQSDLAFAQEEVAEAEARYSTLQAQQLSSMSSTEVTRSLRGQIEELEMRVLRRTEQIGIHQHDIKRLETNLKLQEERIGEMTSELETLGEQKEAMVWDCADAREARDEAIRKCERLELEIEALEERLETSEGERQQETVTLVEVIVETTARLRTPLNILALKDNSAVQAEEALAVAQVELKSKSSLLEASQKSEEDLQAKADALQEDLNQKIADAKRLEQHLYDLQQRPDVKATSESQAIDQLLGEHTEQKVALQKMLGSTAAELQGLKVRHSDAELCHQQALEEANRSKVELESHLAVALERLQANVQLEGELVKLRADHMKEIDGLQEQIRRVENELQDIIRCRAELEIVHQTIMTRTKEEYEAHLSKATLQSLDATRQHEDDLANVKIKHAEAVGDLERQLKHVVEEVGCLQARLQEEVDIRDTEIQTLKVKLQSKAEECWRAQSLEAELHQEIVITRTQLDQTRTALQSLEAERGILQIETTNLGVEIQRTISLNRSLENEVKTW
jgi:chromosome segregation ATPase